LTTFDILRLESDTIGRYLSLAKARSILPHLITASAAMFIAVQRIPPVTILFFTLLGGACVAAAANTFNSLLDTDIDALMMRTRHRPLPSGSIHRNQALVFGIVIGIAGVFTLGKFVGWIPAALAVLALLYYVVPYTLWLKRKNYWSAIVGSGAGALPPLIGWWAVTSKIEAAPFLLSVIVILWTLPHFWTLAIVRQDDYERAGINNLPLTGAILWITVSSFLLVAFSMLLKLVANLGLFYIMMAIVLGIVFLILVWQLRRNRPQKYFGYLYRYSIFYIGLLFASIIIDKLWF